MAMQSGFIKRIRDIMRMDAGINGDAQRIEQMVWMLFLKVYDAKEDDWELNEDNYESIIPEDLRWRNWAKADGTDYVMSLSTCTGNSSVRCIVHGVLVGSVEC